MLGEFLQTAAWALEHYGRKANNLRAASELLETLYGPALRVRGVGRVIAVSTESVTLAMRGTNPEYHAKFGDYVSVSARAVDIAASKVLQGDCEAAARELERALQLFVPEGDGAFVWIVPDGYMAALSAHEQRWAKEGGGYFSHESVCVQNTGPKPTRCELFVYFEAPGREVLCHSFPVGARTSVHLRLDKLPGAGDAPFIPKGTPVGYKVVSYDGPVVVQGSRILTSGRESEFASFGTTMAWTPE